MGTRNLTDTLPFLQMSGGIGLAGISRKNKMKNAPLPPLPALHLEFYWKWVLSDETVTVCIFGRGGVDSVFDL